MVVAESKGLVKGKVIDEKSLKPIAYANVMVNKTLLGTYTDREGNFKLQLSPGIYELVFLHVSYRKKKIEVNVSQKDTVFLSIKLPEETGRLGIITVEAARKHPLSVYKMNAKSIKNLPALAEPDIFRAIAFLPGVSQPDDYTVGLNFRGGNSDQNMVYLDNVALYNPYHLFGLFGSFNTNIISQTMVHTAHFPAKYSGYLSGVIEVESKKRETANFINGNLSLISANIAFAHTWKNTYVLAAVRRTYLDYLLKLNKKRCYVVLCG